MAWEIGYRLRFAEADIYQGPAERFTAELKGPPEQLLPTKATAAIISYLTMHIEEHGGKPLEVTVWADKSPTWQTFYKVEYTVHASPLAWTVVVVAVAAALIAVGIAFTTWKVTSLPWVKGAAGATMAIGGIALLIILALVFMGKKKE